MNKHFVRAGIAAGLSLAGGLASAQSSATVYGRLNVSIENQKIGANDAKWVEQNSSSRIGFKGTEDLGGGLMAGFKIEHGFSPDTGVAADPFWGRQSEVNLSGGFGTVRLGNFTSEAYYATADYVSMHNHDTGTSSDALYAGLGRKTNKVAYRLPGFVKDLSVEAAVSLGEGAANQEKNYDVAVNYAIGGLQLGFGYEQADTTTVSRDQFAVRAAYTAGPVTVGGYVQRDKNAFGAGNRTNVRLAGMYTLGSSEFHLNVGSAGDTGDVADSSAKQFTVAYNYNLSKRTKVYGFYTKRDDSAAALYAGDFRSFALGLRHNF
jgi:predicted porin